MMNYVLQANKLVVVLFVIQKMVFEWLMIDFSYLLQYEMKLLIRK